MNDQLNFLHINASDIRWGASLSAYRLHKALLESGYGGHIYCGLKESSGRDVTSIVPGRYGYIPNALVGKFFNLLGLQSFGYPSSFFIKNFALFGEWADITVIKNIHWWYFSMDVLPWISEKTPIIWRLTDMWPFTGHCAFSYECSRWQTGCGNCPHLFDYPKLYIDTTNFLWKRKKKIFESLKGKLTFVAPSNWLKNIAENSPLTKDFPCEYIPTAVVLAVFKPIDKSTARHVLGINEEDKVIMFSSFKLSEKRKGGLEFVEVIKS
ncbi:MAG: hypothetical protein PHV17_05080, partial [Candidatus Omnitrophica bacterium]|nr:hypothetical protein [Candidatus Omnitrophota bacterium]